LTHFSSSFPFPSPPRPRMSRERENGAGGLWPSPLFSFSLLPTRPRSRAAGEGADRGAVRFPPPSLSLPLPPLADTETQEMAIDFLRCSEKIAGDKTERRPTKASFFLPFLFSRRTRDDTERATVALHVHRAPKTEPELHRASFPPFFLPSPKPVSLFFPPTSLSPRGVGTRMKPPLFSFSLSAYAVQRRRPQVPPFSVFVERDGLKTRMTVFSTFDLPFFPPSFSRCASMLVNLPFFFSGSQDLANQMR